MCLVTNCVHCVHLSCHLIYCLTISFAGTVFFIIRWWDPITFAHHAVDDTGPWPAWPLLENDRQLWTWLFVVPLIAYSVWQFLYLLVVNVLRRQRLLRDPEVMTSFRCVPVNFCAWVCHSLRYLTSLDSGSWKYISQEFV